MPSIDVNGTTLEHRVDGPDGAPAVLLSNSLASALAMWAPQVPALVDAGFRVIRYDSRGHGGSAVPPGPYDMRMLAEDAVALLDALDVERAHFCGLSKGGMVGQWLGAHHGDRLRSLTVCDTAAHMPPPEMWDQRIEAVRGGGMAAVVDATLERWFTPAGRERLPEAVTAVREMILATPPAGFCACCAAIRDMDQRQSIRTIRTPTHVVVGADDPSTPPAAAELIHAHVPGSQLTVLPEAAHLANLEQAEAFNAALLAFLAQHRD